MGGRPGAKPGMWIRSDRGRSPGSRGAGEEGRLGGRKGGSRQLHRRSREAREDGGPGKIGRDLQGLAELALGVVVPVFVRRDDPDLGRGYGTSVLRLEPRVGHGGRRDDHELEDQEPEGSDPPGKVVPLDAQGDS